MRWTPSEFVSSRGSRSETKTARPEDFMDEEDKQAGSLMHFVRHVPMLSDATRLAATEDFGTLGSTQRELARKRAAARSMQASGSVLGALPDALIDDLIIPSSELIGVRLLKRMGWRQGQGIGPRVSRRQRKPEDGPYSDDDTPVNATFAPIDSAVILFAHKANHFGLGFDPYKDAPEFNHLKQAQSESGYLSTVGSRVPKTGFGFGVLGDSDDEDDDVYSSGPKQGRFAEQEPGISGIPNKRQRHFNSSASSKPTSTSSLFCSDGRPPLAGFILSPAKPQSLKWYAAPVVPHDFIPLHEFSSSSKTTDPVKQQGRSKLTADDRALALGETPIDAPRRSVFEYMSAENKNRLDGILGFVLDTEGEKHQRKDHWEVPKMEKSAAEAALQGFMPFADNISKQHRYKQYLNIQAGLSEETIERVEGFSGEDMTKELNEFLQAARIFKPMSSSMASRFTSASKVVEFVQPAAGLRSADDIQSRLSEKASPEHRVVERGELPKSQAAKAAAMGMFGPLTRSTVDFFPNKLLCKRFNVPNPHPDHKNVGPDAAKDLLGKATMDRMMMEGNLAGVPLSNEVSMGAQGEVQTMSDLAAEGPAEELEQQFEAGQAMQERPPMDIFKAIFDDSDSDSDSDSYPDVEQTGIPSEGDGVASGAAAVQQRGHEQEQEAETTMRMENALEGAPAIPFRPIFTRKTDREGRPSSSRPRSPNRASKIGLRHVDNPDGEEDREEEDGDGEMGPRLDFSKRKVARGGTSRKPTFIGSSQHPNKDQDTATTFDDHHSRSGEFIGPPVEPAHVSQATLAGVKDSAHEGQGCNKDGGIFQVVLVSTWILGVKDGRKGTVSIRALFPFTPQVAFYGRLSQETTSLGEKVQWKNRLI
ncbi:hypothetical protein BGX33_005097 [Mortierella sp. NVP41]|nr:hypothetical protein BGX33_005097 [Mortierella sp. NVP41]